MTRQEVKQLFGEPVRSRREDRHFDEYVFDDCLISFIYRKDQEHVAFVELGRPST